MPHTIVSNPLLSFEHRVLRRVAGGHPQHGWLVAVSGGVDSMVLAEVVRRWRKKLCDRVVFAHVHHGRGPVHRDEAQDLVRTWARGHRLPFVTNAPSDEKVRDEASLRRLRFDHLERWRTRYGLDLITLGHHRGDLIETRLQRLIRGTGPRGLVGMRARDRRRLRPLLDVNRAEIVAYARGRKLAWVEDPSNADPAASLRAWIRHHWVPALEQRRPGSTAALARSLELAIPHAVPTIPEASCAAVRRAAFAALTPVARARVVSDHLRALGIRDYGRTHVLEVLKRLDSDRKDFTFGLRGVEFHVGAHHWWASRVCD